MEAPPPDTERSAGKGNPSTDVAAKRTANTLHHWLHWGIHLVCVVAAGCLLIPYFRSQPESLHSFLKRLANWQQAGFYFAASTVLIQSLLKLFSPRLSHRHFWRTHPPIWSAWMYGAAVLCAIDLNFGLSKGVYSASYWDWAWYGVSPLITVAILRRLSSAVPVTSPDSATTLADPTAKQPNDWPTLEAWLSTESPAKYDFLGHFSVSNRLDRLLRVGVRSVGIVGPFGAGKSSIVEWLKRLSKINQPTSGPRVLFSSHNCWGFEKSSTAIHSMLVDAVAKVEEHVDTFHVRSLPESYRQTFSAGGEWLDSVSKLVFGQRDPLEQFRRLSDLLEETGFRLVFIVEDLDRNDSRSFDIQEVLAFLYQLRAFSGFSFILTGGPASTGTIDFSKLCDQIEILRTLSPENAGSLVATFRGHCLNPDTFPHVTLTSTDDNQWNPELWAFMPERGTLSPPEAVAILLQTPRALRHSLNLTRRAWKALAGEIDFDHLLAINVLRYAAPEAFSFLVRHWERLRERPRSFMTMREDPEPLRQRLLQDWEDAISDVDWDVRAAVTLIGLMLPRAGELLGETRFTGNARPQGIQFGRYWRRAVSGEIGDDEIRDQAVIQDMRSWLASPRGDAPLVMNLRKSSAYSDVWEDLAGHIVGQDSGRILLLAEHVLNSIRDEEGALASSDSQGFIALWRYANRYVTKSGRTRKWLCSEIDKSAEVSVELVNSLWHYWGASSYSILRDEDCQPVKQHLILALKKQLTGSKSLRHLVHPAHRYVYYQLVFDPGGHVPVLAGPEHWRWLSPVLLDGLKDGQTAIAIGVCSLIASRDGSSRSEPSTANVALLMDFFGEHACEAIGLIERLMPQIGDEDRAFVADIVRTAKEGLSEDSATTESE